MKPLGLRLLLAMAVGLVLVGTLALYQHPDFLVQMADQLWSCF